MTLEAKLQKLIELGNDYWFGLRTKSIYFQFGVRYLRQYNELKNQREDNTYSLNDLCSIDSGLRQFVCEKGLYEGTIHKYVEECWIDVDDTPIMSQAYNIMSHNYRIMTSSISEDKEKFLLNSIVLPTT